MPFDAPVTTAMDGGMAIRFEVRVHGEGSADARSGTWTSGTWTAHRRHMDGSQPDRAVPYFGPSPATTRDAHPSSRFPVAPGPCRVHARRRPARVARTA